MFQVLETAVKTQSPAKTERLFSLISIHISQTLSFCRKIFFCHCPQKQCRKRKHQYDIFKAFRRQCDRAVCRRVPDPPASHNIRQRIDPHISVDQCLKQDHHCKKRQQKEFSKEQRSSKFLPPCPKCCPDALSCVNRLIGIKIKKQQKYSQNNCKPERLIKCRQDVCYDFL